VVAATLLVGLCLGADRAAEDPEFVLGELWQSLGPGGGEDLWEAWVGGF
jgi:hypothetical protein